MQFKTWELFMSVPLTETMKEGLTVYTSVGILICVAHENTDVTKNASHVNLLRVVIRFMNYYFISLHFLH